LSINEKYIATFPSKRRGEGRGGRTKRQTAKATRKTARLPTTELRGFLLLSANVGEKFSFFGEKAKFSPFIKGAARRNFDDDAEASGGGKPKRISFAFSRAANRSGATRPTFFHRHYIRFLKRRKRRGRLS
jgi:hypothetical protein